MTKLKVFDSYSVKRQTFQTAIESACMLLRIDDIVSGISSGAAPQKSAEQPDEETFGDNRDG